MNLKNNNNPCSDSFYSQKKQARKINYKPGIRAEEGKIVVIADDFTGANDTGVQFSKRKLKSIVITDKKNIHKSLNDCDVLVFDTESRFDDKVKAYDKTYETGKILKAENIKCIYKKLDSTFRGNTGAEISGLMDALEIQHTLLVPAFPSNQRITENGMVYVKGKLLAETEVSDDPRTPVRESSITKIISQQTEKSVQVINLKEVKAGKENLIQKVQQYINDGIQIIVIDAKDNADLDLIASAAVPIKERILFAGSPGFAEYLPKYLNFVKEEKSNVVIAGSVSEVTRKQIDYAVKRLNIRLIDVNVERIFIKKELREKNRIMGIVRRSSLKGEDIVIRSAPSRAFVSKSVELGLKNGLTGIGVSEAIALFLGEIASDIIRDVKINGILLTGGDTAIKTAQSLNITGTIIEDEIQSGIPYGHFIEEQYKNIVIVTKAGGFGSEDAIFQVLNFLKRK